MRKIHDMAATNQLIGEASLIHGFEQARTKAPMDRDSRLDDRSCDRVDLGRKNR